MLGIDLVTPGCRGADLKWGWPVVAGTGAVGRRICGEQEGLWAMPPDEEAEGEASLDPNPHASLQTRPRTGALTGAQA